MTILSASWADFGYRKVGPLPASGNGLNPSDIVARLKAVTDYEATPDNWIRRFGRRKGSRFPASIEFAAIFGKDSSLDDAEFDFLDRHSKSAWANIRAGLPQFETPFSDVTKLINDAENAEKRWRSFYFLSSAISFAAPQFLRPILRQHLLPCFFRLNPGGKVIVLRYDTKVDECASLMRTLYAMAQSPIAELQNDSFQGVQMLREWHLVSLSHLMPALLDFFNYQFYPLISGARASIPGLAFLFLMDPAEKHMPGPYPRNWLGFASTSASFADEAMNAVELVTDPKGAAAQRAGHQRFCHDTNFSADDRLRLLRWYVERLNRLMFELTDAANFTENLDPNEPIDPVFGYEHQITVDRIFRKTLLAMSLDVAPTANLMAFEIADLYDTLSKRLKNTTQDTEFFKRLFNTSDAPAHVRLHTAGMPEPFATYFADTATNVYRKIEETVLASVWRKSKVTPAGVLVRNKALTAESPMPTPQFVAETMRAYRNAHHGYFTSGDPANRPSRYLYLVDGNLPVEMSALPALWWLSYLANPAFLGWNHLPISAFD